MNATTTMAAVNRTARIYQMVTRAAAILVTI